MWACTLCGWMTTEMGKLDDHLIVEHVERVVEYLVDQALREALEVRELERMWKRSGV